MLPQLSLAQAKREAWNLAHVVPRLALAYAKAKQLYIRHFPDHPRPFMAEGHRDTAVQAHYYAQGRTAPGPIVTYKKPGTSKHEREPAGAFDVWLIGDDGEVDWTPRYYADFAGMMYEADPGLVWGGSWKKFRDIDHFEVPE